MFLWLLAALYSISSFAHQTSLTPSGSELFWANRSIPVTVLTNTSDMSTAEVRNIISTSMNQWNSVSSAKMNLSGSSTNQVKFVSNFQYGSAVIGLTELSYNSSGAIKSANILLNDDYTFQSAPGKYYGSQVYLGDVVTHEMGHLLGLSHSEVLNSSMFYSSFSGQSTLSLDDRSGVRQKYDSSSYGSISGTVKGGDHVGVLGAHVQAISLSTGEASGAISDENGDFVLGGLDIDDAYYLYVSPVKNADSLPGYFANVQDDFCPGKYVGSFFSKCGGDQEGFPQAIKLTATAPVVELGTVSISCNLKSSAVYNAQKIATSFEPVSLFTAANYHEKREQAFVGWFRNPSLSAWSSSDIFTADYSDLPPGDYVVKFSIVSFPLGTQLEYEVDVFNTVSQLAQGQRSLDYVPLTQTYHPDIDVWVPMSTDVARNKFEFRVRSRKLGNTVIAETFPDALTFSSGTYLPYLVTVSLWDNSGAAKKLVLHTEDNLSDNDSCLDAPFTYQVAKTREPSGDAETTEEQSPAAGCGTIETPRGGPPSGASLTLTALGFIIAMLASRLTKSRKKFLS